MGKQFCSRLKYLTTTAIYTFKFLEYRFDKIVNRSRIFIILYGQRLYEAQKWICCKYFN